MDPFTLYFIFQADQIHGMFVFLLVAGVIGCIASLIIYAVILSDDGDFNVKYYLKLFLPLLVLGGIGTTIMPTTNNLIAIYGIHHITKVASSNEQVQQLPDNFLNYLNTYLESEVKKLEGDNE